MTWIATFKGRALDLLEPRVTAIDFDEIAHVLAVIPRFNGHTLRSYSVAEHSCRVAGAMPARFQIYGLLHDAKEYAVGDRTSPYKEALMQVVPQHAGVIKFATEELDRRADEAIHIAAGLPYPIPAEALAAVKAADLALLATEKRDLLAPCERDWLADVKPLPEFITPWTRSKAADEFKRQFARLSQVDRRVA